jgi:hypothetical protein
MMGRPLTVMEGIMDIPMNSLIILVRRVLTILSRENAEPLLIELR